MKKFNLSVYLDSVPYFNFFDVYIKELGIKKEDFLKRIGVTPSSYRKCRKGELNIGDRIIEQIAEAFNLKVPSDKLIMELETFVTKVYNNMYYKIYTSYEDDLSYINELLSKDYIIFPILKTLKLFLYANSNKKIENILEICNELYQEVKKYDKFFCNDLQEIYELIYLTFEANIPANYWIKNYSNAIAYFVLATRSYLNQRYIESLFFAEKAKTMLLKDGNVNRVLYLNNTIMSNLIYVGNYEECYELATTQLLALESIGFTSGFQVKASKKFQVVALLGKKEYKEIKKLYYNKERFNLTEIICLLVALYMDDKKTYETYYKDIISDREEEELSFYKYLNIYLKNKNKASLEFLENQEIMKHLIVVLKNIVIG